MVRRSEFTDAVVKSSGLPFPEDEPDPDFEHFASAPPKLEDLLKEFPLFNTADPKENLSSLIDKFSTEPTPENSASLIHALNVLSPLVQHDQRAKVLVEKGNEVLNTIHITENADIHTRLTLYKHGNFGHPSLHITSNRNYKYQYFRHIYLRDYNLHEAISSLIIMSGESFLPSRTILFGDPDFTGEFRTFTIPSGQQNPATNQVPYIGDDLNDKVSSGLIVNNTGSTWKFPLDRQSGLSDRLRYFFGFIRGMKNIGDPYSCGEGRLS